MDEKELMILAKRGDNTALARLYQENFEFLIKYLLKITMSRDLAEELAQETMLKSIEKIKLYNGKAKFSTWLISIATNLYIDLVRKQKRHRNWQQAEQQLFRKLKWETESRNDEWNDTLTALGNLSEDVRIPIMLKHYYGYSYEEIGQMLQISSGTIKSRIHNGINTVRKELKLDESENQIKQSRS